MTKAELLDRLREARDARDAYVALGPDAEALDVRANDFAAELEGRGFRRAVSAGRRYYVGIGLVAHDCDDDREGLQ